MATTEGAADTTDTASAEHTEPEPEPEPERDVSTTSTDAVTEEEPRDVKTNIPDPIPQTADPSPPPADPLAATEGAEAGDSQTRAPPSPPTSDGEEVVSKKPKTDAPPPSIPEVLYRADWTPKCERAVVIDRIKGCLYGNALGDAMGLATEFMSKLDVQQYYKGSGPIPFQDIVPDFHRARWTKGDWTDDTDQMMLILEGIVESGGKVEGTTFAKKLRSWAREGFPELGDKGGLGIGMTVHTTLVNHKFLTDPHSAAYAVWEQSGKYLAANGAVMRTSVLGLLSFNQIETVVKNTLEISKTTHADPRCSASCVAVTSLISQLLQSSNPCTQAELDNIIQTSIEEGVKQIEDEKVIAEFRKHMTADSFQKLDLDEAKAIGYTLKCAGTAFVGLNSKVKNAKGFIKVMTELVREAGDADTNGAVCGAVIGCKIGYSNLPLDWIKKMPFLDWFDRKVEQFLTCIGLGSEEGVPAEVV